MKKILINEIGGALFVAVFPYLLYKLLIFMICG